MNRVCDQDNLRGQQAYSVIRIVLPWMSASATFLCAAVRILWKVLCEMPIWLFLHDVNITTSQTTVKPLKHITFMVLGALIVFFLIVEPNGLARL